MDVWHGVLGAFIVVLAAAAAAAVWAWQRVRSTSATALAEAARARAEAEREALDAARAAEHGAAELARERAARDESGRRVVQLSEERARLAAELEAAGRELARGQTDAERRAAEWAQIEARFREAFGALSGQTLAAQSAEFLKMAQEKLSQQRALTAEELEKRKQAVEAMLKPIGETLAATREKIESLERQRAAGQAEIAKQIEIIAGSAGELRAETARLSKALSRPEVRGQYGEMQLRRVAELAGMVSYCDFTEQASARDDRGVLQRPDMIVRLPNGRVVAVDAKTNISAYIEAVHAGTDAERDTQLDRFARHVAEQAKSLSDKRYWAAFEGSPEFVVMFVPGDQFIDAALARRPDLLETAAQHNVILASPSTLIGLLRAVAVGWREHSLSERAAELFDLGRELHDRTAVVFEHTSRLGSSLRQAVNGYNQLVGSMEGRLGVTLRKFEQAGAKSAKDLIEGKPVEVEPRAMLTDGS